jgi:hypothetical protein
VLALDRPKKGIKAIISSCFLSYNGKSSEYGEFIEYNGKSSEYGEFTEYNGKLKKIPNACTSMK